MTRICPVCKKSLGGYDYYFCSSCGNELPVDSCNTNHLYRKVVDLRSEVHNSQELFYHFRVSLAKMNEIINTKLLLGILFGALFLLSGFMAANSWLNVSNNNPVVPKASPPKPAVILAKNILYTDAVFKSDEFSADSITKFIPYGIDIYVEGNDFEPILASYSKIDPYYERLFNSSTGLLKNHWAMFGKTINGKMEWGFILYPVSLEGVRISELIKDFPWLSHKDKDGVYIISTNSDLLRLAEEATNGDAKDLSMNPKYSQISKLLPKNGKFFVMIFSKDGKVAWNTLISTLDFPENLGKVVKSFSESELEYAIIL